MKKFYAVIGNPPYQEDTEGSGRSIPIYPSFMEEAYKVGEKVELITPARFLFNRGFTSKEFNQRMLDDKHIKVMEYESDATQVFPSVDIRGGVAVTYRDSDNCVGPIGVMLKDERLRPIMNKVLRADDFSSFASIVGNRGSYHLTKLFYDENPWARPMLQRGTKDQITTSAFSELRLVFFELKPDDEESYVKVLGRSAYSRKTMWIRESYIKIPASGFDAYKVAIPKASGSGDFGEGAGDTVVLGRREAHTDTFISIGCFESVNEAEACQQYIRTKFTRAMLGILKVTQDITSSVWKYVPLQDFTDQSDIDWSQSVSDIDRQLYRKYGLDNTEIEFIESHVKEMN